MNTIISKGNNDYRMSVIYDKTTRTYILVFSSVKNNHGEQYTCASYADAVKRFIDNCRFYGAEIPRVPLTEEEFLGLNPGTLYPSTKKEVSICRA